MRRLLLIIILIVGFIGADIIWTYRSSLLNPPDQVFYQLPKTTFWGFQSIDTMKYSRDIARERADDKKFDAVIDRQVKAIADTGATHVAIATPYDEEFIPFMKRWVEAARKHHLKVWFRGNFSGWEGWFEYSDITREEHIAKTRGFILKHPDLFEDGDAFSSCPECENGGPGDPRQTGDAREYRKFLIDEYKASKTSFNQIGKNVRANLFSMNGDVARLIMDDATTASLDNAITIDHYVGTPEKLLSDAKDFSKGGKKDIILGEFGVPIPDIHGKMSDDEQARWIESLLEKSIHEPYIKGMNYWLSVGGSTELWDSDGKERKSVSILRQYYTPKLAHGFVYNALGFPVASATIKIGEWQAQTDRHGHFELLYPGNLTSMVTVSAKGYETVYIAPNSGDDKLRTQSVILAPTDITWKYKILYWFKHLSS